MMDTSPDTVTRQRSESLALLTKLRSERKGTVVDDFEEDPDFEEEESHGELSDLLSEHSLQETFDFARLGLSSYREDFFELDSTLILREGPSIIVPAIKY